MHTILVPAVTVVVEIIKKTELVPPKWLPLVSVVVALLLGYITDTGALESLLVGGAAVGLYEISKNVLTK